VDGYNCEAIISVEEKTCFACFFSSTIEEYFKYIQKKMKFSQMNEQTSINIQKTIIAQSIISMIVFLITNMIKTNDKKIVNKSLLTNGVFDKLIYRFFNDSKISRCFVKDFITIYITFIKNNKGMSNQHTCKRPNFISYFKKYSG
jgi:hypothetical protein